jgi:inorganic triphosphatase YgiF
VERELKLQLEPGARAGLARAPELATARPCRRRLVTIYFDTPDLELAHHGLALRLRRDGQRWIESLKGGGPGGAGGLHMRDEWEFPRSDAGIDLARFASTPLARLRDAGSLHARLAPVFTVDCMRTTWLLEPAPGCRLEVALDEGHVQAGGRREAIRELEIECIAGGLDAAFALAARLAARHRLRPCDESKAQRGYRLLRGGERSAVKAQPVRLARSMGRLEAARAIVAAGIAQLQANEEGVLQSSDSEFMHQARIALRRTRSALRIFRGTRGFEAAERQRGVLAGVARALGQARDWDVFVEDSLPAAAAAYGEAALPRRLASQAGSRRDACRDAARRALRARPCALAMIELARGLAMPAANAHGDPSLRGFAAAVMRKRHRRMVRAARRIADLGPAERHRLRIRVKRLRYGTDAFASLFAARHIDPYLEALADLQDALGAANDAATAARLLAELRVAAPFARFARAWFDARSAIEPAALESLLERIEAAPHPWRHAGRSIRR